MTTNASTSRYGKAYVTVAQAKECLRKAGYTVTKDKPQTTVSPKTTGQVDYDHDIAKIFRTSLASA
jgi:hypothetical protein